MPRSDNPSTLVVGPLLRYVDESRATVWVETDRACSVDVVADGRRHHADTWSVHGHHYALVRLDELPTSVATEYQVLLDDHQVWPEPGSGYPPSVIRTTNPDTPFRLLFGSCRRSAPFDEEHLDTLGADALVALAESMRTTPVADWPDALLMIGDQIYADDPSEAIVERLHAAHPDVDPEVDGEIGNFEEYTWLYAEAWMEPTVRWLLSTVPSAMLLDDHDLRDDWNTSLSWRRWVTAQPWWRDRVVGGYGSYWVYQHLGNLSPEQLAGDEVYARLLATHDDDERTRHLDGAAWAADVDSTSIRFSYYRDLGATGRGVRLVSIDSRCSRQLDPDDRRMVDPPEWEWVRDAVLGTDLRYDHLVLASTLPFLLPPGLHHLEGWDEAISEGAWKRPGKWTGEKLRQALDLEHWASFRASFREVIDLLRDVVGRHRPPATVLLLSGDVHCNYTAHAELDGLDHPGTVLQQLTMSPFRNDIERAGKAAEVLLNRKFWTRVMHRMARMAHVDDVAMSWQVEHGPWFDNGVMAVTFEGRSARLGVDHAHVDSGRQVLSRTLDLELASAEPAPDNSIGPATAAV